MALKEDATKAAISAVNRHWRLWEWFNGKVARAVSQKAPFRPDSLRSLWQEIGQDHLKDGDFIEFRTNIATDTYWYLQEWVPRAPGAVWFEDDLFRIPRDILASILLDDRSAGRLVRSGKISPELHELLFLFYSPFGHWEQEYRAGASNEKFTHRLGSYRPALTENDDRYALLSVVSRQEFFVDLAFPIVVSKEVYKKFVNAQDNGRAVEIEAIVEVQEVKRSNEFQSYIQALGSHKQPQLESVINTPLRLRNLVGYIGSPLDLNVRYSTSHPLASLRIEGHNGKELTRREGIILISRSIVEDPSDLRNHQRSTLGFMIGDHHQFGTSLIPITDFDARIRWFRTDTSLSINPKIDPNVLDRLRLKVEA